MPSKHLVFVFHGMGQASEGWSNNGIKSLRAGWNKLQMKPAVHGLEFEFFPIDYNAIFERYWNAVEQHSTRFAGIM